MRAQNILESTGIPTYPGVWRETDEYPQPPDAYIVHTQMRVESFHADDKIKEFRIFDYANLWSKEDPTDLAMRVREAMYADGWAMQEEFIEYDDNAKRFHVSWTWTTLEDSDDAV